jgi:hypothetical protein
VVLDGNVDGLIISFSTWLRVFYAPKIGEKPDRPSVDDFRLL